MLRISWSNIGVSRKFAILMAATVLGLGAVMLHALRANHDSLVGERVAKLRALTDVVVATAPGLEAEVKAGTLTREAAMAMVQRRSTAMRYDGDNYVAVYDSFAGQTDRATQEISAQVAAIQDTIRRATAAMGEVAERARAINGVTDRFATAVETQVGATQAIVRGVAETAAGTATVRDAVEGLALAAEATGDAARRVLQAAGAVAQQSAGIGAEVRRFLATPRAARGRPHIATIPAQVAPPARTRPGRAARPED